MTPNIPNRIELDKSGKNLTLTYSAENIFDLSAEYLRVYSPSAEVQGHGVGNEILQTGKRNVSIKNIEQTGNYALKLTYSDGHDSGLYTWDYLAKLCENEEKNWGLYLERLKEANASRD